jgi:hypothetical protein
MKGYEFVSLICTSVALLILATFLFYYSQQGNIDFDESRYDRLLSRKETMANTAAEHQLTKIMKLSKEFHKSSSELNSRLVSSVYWLGWTLLSIAIIQLSIVVSFYKSQARKGIEPHNLHLSE